jgi:LemA protein
MSTTAYVLIGLAFLAVLAIILFNRLVALRQTYRNAFSDVDVQLKQRYDLVPNLVETVKGYATHESGVFEKVTEARATAMRGGSLAARSAAEGALSGAVSQLLAVAENYPQLKANENFLKLQSELEDLENKIAAARRFFNNAVAEYNTATGQFPAVLFARSFGFSEAEMFTIDASEKAAVNQAPKVSFGNPGQ